MNLYSIHFVLFILIDLVLYYTIFQKKQWICLLLASLYFYFWMGSGNGIFILVTSFTVWLAARAIERYRGNERVRRLLFWSALVFNFLILAYLKYFRVLFPKEGGLLLPLGISFYTFQTMAYLIDVYNGKYAPEKNYLYYLLFVSFFPQLIQGPINRYDALGQQFQEKHVLSKTMVQRSLLRILFGFMKKYAIADVLAGTVCGLLDHPELSYPGAAIFFGIFLYAIQQYADFSGGIDIVMGVAGLFDIKMAENFRQPYFSTSLAEFWRRWHITLGQWMRDYIFYPFALTRPMKKLGKFAKNKMGRHMGRVLPAAIGNLLVFFVVGIWHGAKLHFVLWGLYNGIIIALSDMLSPVFKKWNAALHIRTESKGFYVFRVLRTFLIVNIGGYFDRIVDLRDCFWSMKQTVVSFEPSRLFGVLAAAKGTMPNLGFAAAFLAIVLVFASSVIKEKGTDLYEWFENRNVVVKWILLYVMIIVTLFGTSVTTVSSSFMYANF